MSFVTDTISNVIGSVTGSKQAASAAQGAAATQSQAAQAGIDEQRRQFDALVQIMSPYVQAGTAALPGIQPYMQAGESALGQQTALLGLSGPEAQAQAIAGIESGSEFQALSRQGEEALLQNASASSAFTSTGQSMGISITVDKVLYLYSSPSLTQKVGCFAPLIFKNFLPSSSQNSSFS